jgi:murein DD-endopeptidase MepM/ murein hydrolase activator NlpD
MLNSCKNRNFRYNFQSRASIKPTVISTPNLLQRRNRVKRLKNYIKDQTSHDGTVSYLKEKSVNTCHVTHVWRYFSLPKKAGAGLFIVVMTFVPFFNMPEETSAEYSIDSATMNEQDFLSVSPVGTASVKTEVERYVVQEGETLDSLSKKYNVSSYTISLANGLAWDAKLKVGQELKVPPVSGLLHEVKKGDSISSVAKKYSVTPEIVLYQNGMNAEDTLVVGKELIIPNGILPQVRNITATAGRSETTSGGWNPGSAQLPSIDSAGTLVKPSNSCVYTQYYHAGHYAIDCAAPVGTPLYAADGGTVTKVTTGSWGGGYGNHVIVDHGNGIKTLYAHMNVVYVSEGQWVSRGENIGTMGNTGRSTGPHIHFEVIKNGVKVNPLSYF